MRGILRVVLCVALLGICVAPYPATAQDEVMPDCVKTAQPLHEKVAVCQEAAWSGDAKA